MPTTTLRWQWPAGRPATATLTVRVTGLRPAGGGLFAWFRRSPSLVPNLPDPVALTGTRTDRPGEVVRLQLPRAELNEVAVGSLARLALVSPDVCTGVDRVGED